MEEIVIKKEDSNQRVDKFLKKYLPLCPTSFLYKTFRKKDIKINKKWVKENYILKENDLLSIYIKEEDISKFKKSEEIIKVYHPLDIIYEDENILIINKERGLLVHGDKKEKVKTLQNYVLSYLISKNEYNPKIDTYLPSPCHRLDQNTSGIVIFAKNLITSQEIMNLLKNKNLVKKNYLALVFGNTPKEGEIKTKLRKNENNNFVVIDEVNGKEADTIYKKIKGNNNYSLLDVSLLTGRTHQIRVHLSSIGYPLVGDAKYGDFNKNKEFNKEYHFEKQFLHSYKISFSTISGHLSYLTGLTFKAKLYKKEEDILNKLFN